MRDPRDCHGGECAECGGWFRDEDDLNDAMLCECCEADALRTAELPGVLLRAARTADPGQNAPPALDWWLLFTAVKACVIWTTAASGFASGKNREMTIALSGIRGGHFHRDLVLKMMRERGAMG